MGKQRRGQRPQGAPQRAGSGGINRGYVIAGAILVLFLGGFIGLVIWDSTQRAVGGPPDGVEEFEVTTRDHVEGSVNYEQTPPVGGPHDPVWQNSGFYSEPIRDENAVHTLEHGAVWITYQPDLPQDQVDEIQSLVEGETCTLASPYEGLPSPVVASAWGKQLQLESADDPDLEQFAQAYQQGPQTPEPGALCTGGVGFPA